MVGDPQQQAELTGDEASSRIDPPPGDQRVQPSRAVAASAANTASVSSKIPRSAVWQELGDMPAVSTVGGGTATCSLATDPASPEAARRVDQRATAASSALRPAGALGPQPARPLGRPQLGNEHRGRSRCTSLRTSLPPGAAARTPPPSPPPDQPPAPAPPPGRRVSPSASWTTTTRPPPTATPWPPMANPSAAPPPKLLHRRPGPEPLPGDRHSVRPARSASSSSSPRTSVTGTDPGRAAMPACYPAPQPPDPPTATSTERHIRHRLRRPPCQEPRAVP